MTFDYMKVKGSLEFIHPCQKLKSSNLSLVVKDLLVFHSYLVCEMKISTAITVVFFKRQM